MYSEARKLHLIEEVLKTKDEHTLVAIEGLLNVTPPDESNPNGRFSEFSGIWSKEEADEIEKAINEGCEQIHPDDWK